MKKTRKSLKGIPHGASGKTKLIDKRSKPKRAPSSSLFKDVRDGVRHFWSKRGRDVPSPSYWDK